MTSITRLFEKTADGLLVEVAKEMRRGRRTSHVSFHADVLFTPEEEAARDAEELANAEAKKASEQAASEAAARKQTVLAKLGLTEDEIASIFS